MDAHMTIPTMHHTTAQFANFSAAEACTLLANEAQEAFDTSMDYVQLCPQTPTVFTEETLREVQEAFPETQFQLHANVRVQPRLLVLDASSYNKRSHWYFERLGELSAFINAPAYSLHSGRRRNCTMMELFHNLEAIQQLFDMPVLVEGMYPSRDGPEEYLMSTWKEYTDVMQSGLCYAIDLSHLNIVSKQEGERPNLVHRLIANPNCKEVHISHNNGRHDSHRPITEQIWENVWWKEAWLSALSDRAENDQPLHFTEGLHRTRSHRHNQTTHSHRNLKPQLQNENL